DSKPNPLKCPPMAEPTPMQTAEMPRPATAIRTSLSIGVFSASGEAMNASRTADFGIQQLGVGMQGDIAGAADFDLRFLGRRDIDIAMTADLHPRGAGGDIAEVGAARSADFDIEVVDHTLGDHGAGALDLELGGVRGKLTYFGVARSGDRHLEVVNGDVSGFHGAG